MARQPRITLAVLVCLLLAPVTLGADSVLSGSVRDEAGKPLAGVIVRLMNAESGRHETVSEETDASGRFTFEELPRALYKVSAQSLRPGARFTVWWPDVEVERARQSLDLRLAKTGVTGKIVMKDGGAVPRMASMTLQKLVPRQDGTGETIGGLAGMAWPEPDGSFRFRGIPPGRYRLYLNCRDFRRVERDLTVPKRKLLACQDLVLERLRSGVLRIRVTDADGKPVDGLSFSYHTPDGISHGFSAERVEPGVYSITQLETGTWKLSAYRRDLGGTRFEATVTEGKTTTIEVLQGVGIRGEAKVADSAPGDRARPEPEKRGMPTVRETPPGPFEDEAEARALYERMVAAMRGAKTLSWVSEYVSGSDRYGEGSRCSYAIWLAKPNHVRLEASRRGVVTGILIGDGRHFWTHWPAGRPRRNHEQHGRAARTWERTKDRCYMKKLSPPGRHSIGHETGPLGAGLTMPILDPSTFHGYTDSLQAYVDGYRRLGEETIGDEACDVIEVSIMKGQRSWRLWLSKRDHLPRRLEQVIRARFVLTAVETWKDVRIDAEIPAERFEWRPPAGWVLYRPPALNDGLLKVGRPAPDFDLPLHGGGRIKLSECRGQVVWFYLWRAG